MATEIYEFYYTDHDGVDHRFEPLSAELTRPRQKDKIDPRILEVEVHRGTPIADLGRVKVRKLGTVIFRGYVKFAEILDKNTKRLTCYGMEDLLNYRYSHTFFYDKNDDLKIRTVFSSELADNSLPGLLACANSYLPPGTGYYVYNDTDHIIQFPGLGTDSIVGNRTIYRADGTGVVKLEELPNLATLSDLASDTASNFYRDANNLYVCVGSTLVGYQFELFGGLYIENYKDTTVRLGLLDSATSALDLDGTLLADQNRIGDLIFDVCNTQQLEVYFSDDDNFTFINVRKLEAATGDAIPEYTFYEEDLISLSRDKQESPILTTICGKGQGLTYFARGNYSADLPVRIEELVEYDGEWADADSDLIRLVNEQYDGQGKNDAWTFEPARTDLMLYPGDLVHLRASFESEVFAPIDNIEEDCLTGLMTIDLVSRPPNFSDVWEFMQDIETGFGDQFPIVVVNETSDTTGTLGSDYTYTVPIFAYLDLIDPKYKPKITFSATFTMDTATQYVGRCNFYIYKYDDETKHRRISNISMDEYNTWAIPEIDITDWYDATDTVAYYISAKVTPVGSVTYTSFDTTGTLKIYKRADALA